MTDEQQLLRLHRVAMDDHLFGRTTGMKAMRADSLTIVGDGEVHRLTGEELDAVFERIMASRDYTVYDDLIRPIVRISADGTLGTLTAQVHARGARLDADGQPGEPLDFVSAWIELYEKIDGRWRLTGNVSNFRPAP